MHVVFYRNLNLGHAGSPNREQLEGALKAGGAAQVKSFQTNGTVLFKAEDPEGVVAAAAGELVAVAGYADAAIVRPLADLEGLLALGVFEKHESPRTYRETVTFFQGGKKPSWSMPWTNSKDDVDVLHIGDGIALSLIRKPRNSAGSPTFELERATGGVATTRTRGSIDRLLKAAATWR
ncbi:DUF1697 domain-containing protein [Nocardioides sp.]|uniref:DUF1697 domain-containing protein n=1 Tax=Nocardioides sp. TaxID=35761 RepID=UPI0019BAA3BE|nr:DUF1697 domain-containing protein [Nocardioides sp.]MBC7278408.1 DUF1697 domain-containing protein [Nocardioides sp.]